MKKTHTVLLTLVALTALLTLVPTVFGFNFEESVANGKVIYEESCATCHGAEAEGGVGPALNEKAKLDSLGIENVKHTVEDGVEGTAMAAWSGELSEEEIGDVVNFIFAEWADFTLIGIEMWPWEIAYVVIGIIWAMMGLYYVIRV